MEDVIPYLDGRAIQLLNNTVLRYTLPHRELNMSDIVSSLMNDLQNDVVDAPEEEAVRVALHAINYMLNLNNWPNRSGAVAILIADMITAVIERFGSRAAYKFFQSRKNSSS